MVRPPLSPPTTNLLVWLDAKDLDLAHDASVSTWPDRSGNGNDATQATSASQPTYREDKGRHLPGVRFDGTDDLLDIASTAALDGMTEYTIFLVTWDFEPDSDRVALSKWDQSAADQEWRISQFSSSFTHDYGGTGSAGGAAGVSSKGLWNILTFWRDPNETDRLHSEGWDFDQGSGDAAAVSTTTDVRVGASLDSNGAEDRFYDGYLFEVLIYDSTSAQLREDVQKYLMHKWVEDVHLPLETISGLDASLEDEAWHEFLYGMFPLEYRAGVHHQALSPGDVSEAVFEVMHTDVGVNIEKANSDFSRPGLASGDSDLTDNVSVEVPPEHWIRYTDQDADTTKSLLNEHLVVKRKAPHGNEMHEPDRAEDPHGMGAHLSDVAPSPHGNGHHDPAFASEDSVDGDPGLVWQGPWDSATVYNKFDAVSHDKSSWIATQSNDNSEPSRANADWDLLADGVDWRGPWDSTVTYEVNDSVSRNGRAWIAVAENTNSEPSTANADWELFAEKGDTGQLTWQGLWASQTAYATDDVVRHDGRAWVAVSASTGVTPARSASEWELLAEAINRGGTSGSSEPVEHVGTAGQEKGDVDEVVVSDQTLASGDGAQSSAESLNNSTFSEDEEEIELEIPGLREPLEKGQRVRTPDGTVEGRVKKVERDPRDPSLAVVTLGNIEVVEGVEEQLTKRLEKTERA